MREKQFYVYIVTNQRKGTLYIGVTNNLIRRIFEHKQKTVKSFTEKYNLTQLVHYEIFTTAYEAISREKRLKQWNREWKIQCIEAMNPDWRDLYCDLLPKTGSDSDRSSFSRG